MLVELTQADYKKFLRKVSILKDNGIVLDYTVASPNKRVVKLTMNKVYDWVKLDSICENRSVS